MCKNIVNMTSTIRKIWTALDIQEIQYVLNNDTYSKFYCILHAVIVVSAERHHEDFDVLYYYTTVCVM